MTTDELIAAARSWIGVPFLHQGRTRFGVDCVGFVECMMAAIEQLPIDYVAPKAYSRRPNGELLQTVARHCVLADGHEVGTLLLVQWRADKEPSHAAICTGPSLIHAYSRAARVVETSYRGLWKRDTHSLWRLPGVIYE